MIRLRTSAHLKRHLC